MARTIELPRGFVLHTFCPRAGLVTAELQAGSLMVVEEATAESWAAAVAALAYKLCGITNAIVGHALDDDDTAKQSVEV